MGRGILPRFQFRTRRVLCVCGLALLASLLSPSRSKATGLPETIDGIQRRVVKIYGAGGLRNLAAYGTGFLVTPEGHIATVWSHVLDADEVTVVLHDGRRFAAKIVNAEPQLDLAIIKIDRDLSDLPHFSASDNAQAMPGTRVLAFSNMFNVAAGDEPVSVIHGVIAARAPLNARRGAFEIPYSGPVYVVDAVTNNSGAAGGLLTTYDGRLLGMIGREVRNAETQTWVNYAVPITELQPMIEQIISGNFSSADSRRTQTENPARYNSLDFGILMVPDVVYRTPAYIDRILPESAAAKVGLQTDDLVVFVNDELVHSCRTLREQLGRLEAGDLLRIVVRRDDQLVTVEMPVPRKDEQN